MEKLELMLITNDWGIAQKAEKAQIDRVFLDMEYIGKFERQGHTDAHISDHEFEDIKEIKQVVDKTKILTRVNPIHKDSEEEIEKAIEYGTDIIMLPMFSTTEEVVSFIEFIDGRVKTCLLLETPQSLVRVNEIIEVNGIDEIHIGLNDLHLGMGLDFMFELLAGGIVDYLADIFNKNNIKWGFGGIARLGKGILPSDYILAEHKRLGSSMVILSRTFHGKSKNLHELKNKIDLEKEVKVLREKEKEIEGWPKEQFRKNREKIKEIVRNYVSSENKLQQVDSIKKR